MAVEVGRGSQMLGLFLNGCLTKLDDRGDRKLLALSNWKDGLAGGLECRWTVGGTGLDRGGGPGWEGQQLSFVRGTFEVSPASL